MVSSLFQLEHVSSNSKGLTNFVINHWFSEIQSLSATYWMTRDTPWSSNILPLGPASRHWSCLLLIWNQIQDPKSTSVQRLKNLWIKLKKLKFAWLGLMFVGAFFFQCSCSSFFSISQIHFSNPSTVMKLYFWHKRRFLF